MLTVNVFADEDDFETYSAGQTIFEEDDVGQVMYGIREGEVDIRLGDRTLETVKPGGIFGELCIIDDCPRMATAVAKTDCKIVPVDQERFVRLVQETPTFALEVMRVLSFRLRRETYPE